jgi:outer membrane protein assembly factor BamB
MKKLVLAITFLPILLSCVLYSTPPLGDTNFPLKKSQSIPIGETIRDIAIGDTWIAVQTNNSIIGLDIDTFATLWKIDVRVNVFGEGFKIVGDRLVTISEGQKLILVDRNGNKEEKALDDDVTTVVRIPGIYPDYVYVVGGSYWSLEVYDLVQDKMLWKSKVGRSIGPVFYDPANNIAYLTKDDSITAYENSSGKVLWKKENVYGRGALFDSGILYVSASSSVEGAFTLAAIEGVSQATLWEKDIVRPTDIKASDQTLIGNLLIFRGYGMFAIDKTNGELVWTVPSIGEEFIETPVEFNGLIYIREDTGSVFAISLKDGTIIGHVKLEERDRSDKVYGGVHTLRDGIVFNTKNDLVIYKPE